MTDEEIIAVVRGYAKAGGLPPPATPAAVMQAEKTIGFALPTLLRRLYLEAANGDFGPAEGILGVEGGASQGDWSHLAEIYEEGARPFRTDPRRTGPSLRLGLHHLVPGGLP